SPRRRQRTALENFGETLRSASQQQLGGGVEVTVSRPAARSRARIEGPNDACRQLMRFAPTRAPRGPSEGASSPVNERSVHARAILGRAVGWWHRAETAIRRSRCQKVAPGVFGFSLQDGATAS